MRQTQVATATFLFVLSFSCPLVAQAPKVRVDAKPTLVIAATSESGEVRFSTAAWATRLASGGVAIADLADANVKVISADGRTSRTIGQRGRGPGDYQFPFWIGRCAADSIVVWDIASARATTLPPGLDVGATPGTWTNADAAGSFNAACATSGAMAFAVGIRPRNELPPIASGTTPQGGQYAVVVMSGSLLTTDAGGVTRTKMPPMPFGEFITGRASSDGGFGVAPRPLGKSTSFAFVGTRVVVAAADSGTVVGYELDGAEAFRFRAPLVATPVTPADYQRAMGPALAVLPAQARDRMAALVGIVPPPTQAPPFWRVLGDPLGLIWLVVSPEGAERTVLRTYTTTGVVVGEHTVPGAFTPFEVGRDYLIGRRENEEGEQEIVVLRVTRN